MTEDDHECFGLSGAVVHGDPEMSQETRDALARIINAAREQFGEPTPEQQAEYQAGQQRIRERNARILGRARG